jgi:hypothetical protein
MDMLGFVTFGPFPDMDPSLYQHYYRAIKLILRSLDSFFLLSPVDLPELGENLEEVIPV